MTEIFITSFKYTYSVILSLLIILPVFYILLGLSTVFTLGWFDGKEDPPQTVSFSIMILLAPTIMIFLWFIYDYKLNNKNDLKILQKKLSLIHQRLYKRTNYSILLTSPTNSDTDYIIIE